MIWVYRATRVPRAVWSGPTFVQAFFAGSGGVLPALSAFWCSLTGMSAMTGGGDIEDLDDADGGRADD